MKEVLPISGAFLVLTAIFQTSSANPAGGNVTVGSATITQNGDILSVVTGSSKTVIDWDSFSIGNNQLTQILQPGANAATLNRVVGTMPSELLGSLVSNGKVALINENGILIGNTGIIDTHGFIGSTLNTSNDAFVANGNLVFSGASEASIVNQGAILAREGDVFLLGRNVTNAGSIEAHNGNAGLAAGGEIVLRKASDEHVYVEVKSSSRGDKVVNSGTIKAIQDDLHHNGGNPYQYAMNTGGTGVNNIQIRPGGGVYLNAGTEGSVVHSGAIKAVKGAQGGDVALSGRTVDVKSGSTIDASGAKAGGSVKVGGGLHGKDASIANSKVTRIEKGATIKADATENGKGGKVVVWSDGATSYQGTISAKGAGSGAGGSAEVSGKEQLDFRGDVDLTAASGKKGDLLLDPANIIIQSSGPDIAGDGTGNDLLLPSDLSDADLDFPGATSIITAAKVADLATLSNLTLAATNDITVNAAIDTTSLSTPFLSLFDLTLQAGHDITVNGDIVNLGTGGINLTAGNDITIGAAVFSDGRVNIEAGRDIGLTNTGHIADNSATGLLVSAGRNLTLDGMVNGAAPGGQAELKFGQTSAGILTFNAGVATYGSVVNVTGGAFDDKVVTNATPINAQMRVDLAGGSNSLSLTTGNDDIVITGPNEISFNTGVFIDHVSSVDGNGGVQNIIQALDGMTMTITGHNALTSGGISFTDFQLADGDGSPEDLTVINATGDAFLDLGHSVAGVQVGIGITVQTPVLNVSGDHAFTVGTANSGNGSLGDHYVGLDTVNGVAATNGFSSSGTDVTITGSSTATAAGIAFTGVNSFSLSSGNAKVINGTSSPLNLPTLSIGGIGLSNFTDFQTAAVVLGNSGNSINLTGPGAITTSFYTLTGLNLVDAGTGTNSLTLTGGADAFNVTGNRAGSIAGIDFTHLSSVNGGAGANSLTNTTGLAFDGSAKSVAGVAFSNFTAVSTPSLNLGTGDDVFTATGAGAGGFNGISYTGLNAVNGLGGSDTFNNGTALAFDAAANGVSGITLSNFETIHTGLLNLTGGDDLFTVTGAGTGSFGGLGYTGLTHVDGLGGSNIFVNQSGGAFSAATMSAGGVSGTGFGAVVTSLLTLTAGDDNYQINGNSGSSNAGIAYFGVTQVDALGGTNTVHINNPAEAFSITGDRAGKGEASNILFTNIDKVVGAGPGDTLNNSTTGAFDAGTSSVAGVTVTGFETINTSLLNLTTGDDSFTATGAGTGTFGAQNFTGLTKVDALGGSDILTDQTGATYDAAGNVVGGSYNTVDFNVIKTASVSLSDGNDTFIVLGPNGGNYQGTIFLGVNSLDGRGGSDTLIDNFGGGFQASTNSVSSIVLSHFETIQTTAVELTNGDDTFTVTGVGKGTFGSLNFTTVTLLYGLGGNDTLVNHSGLAFEGAASLVAGINLQAFETIDTPLLQLGLVSNDVFTLNGTGTGTFGGLNYTGLTTVNALGGNDTFINNSGTAFNAGTNSAGGVTAVNFETVNTALLALTGGADIFTVTGANSGTYLTTSFTGVTNVDGLGGSDTLVNGTALAFDGATNSVAGVTGSNFETVSTALLNLTAGDDLFTVTGANAGTFGTLNFANLTQVDGLTGTNTLVNGTALAFEASTLSVSGVTETNFQTVNTALLNLTGGDDSFALTGAGTGTFAGLNYTGLVSVDALGGSDTFVNNSGTIYNAGTNSAAGVTAVGFETVNTELLALTSGADAFTVTGANSGTYLTTNFTGVTSIDGLGGNDTLVNGTALAYNGANNSVSGITQTNFETVSTALLNLTTGNDVFTVTGANAGTFGTLNFTNLTQVDGLAGGDTLINGTALAFEASTLSVSGVTEAGFETVNTALLNLTTGDDSFALTGAGTGTFAGLNYTGLTAVDGLAGVNTTILTGGDDSFTVTGTRGGTGSGVAFVNLDKIDGAGGNDTLVNGTVLAFEGSTNSVAGVTQHNFEIIDTAKLNLTTGDDLFTVTGTNTGTFGALTVINLTQVDGLAGSDTLVNSTTGAFDGATNTVAGVTESNFETVSTALLTLTGGDDLFTVTGSGTGAFGALNFTNLTQVDALGGSDTVILTAGNDSLTVTGTGAATTSGIVLSSIESVDGSTGNNAITLTSGDDIFTVTGSRAGNGLGIAFSNIDSVDGAGGTNTFMGTAVADAWSVTGTNAGSLLGVGFNHFSQLRSGGSAVDVFDFTAGGDITGFISGADGGGLNLAALAFTNNGVTTNLTGSVRAAGLRLGSTAGGSVTLLNSSNNVGTLAANLDGSLSFTNSLGYTVGTVDGVTGITTTGDAIVLNSGTGPITLASDVTTGSTAAGDITFSKDVVLVSNATVTGGSAQFGGAVDGGFGLTVESAGATTFSGAVGGNVALSSLTTDLGGSTAVNGGGVTTSGAQVYGDTVTLGAPASVFTGSAVTFAATLDGASATTVNAVTTLFNGAVGGSTALTSLTTDATGTTTVGGLVATTGLQIYNDAVTLGSATSVFNGAAVTFGSTLDGSSDVTVNAATTTFGGAVGGLTALTSLTTDAAGSTLIQGPGVSTTGNQSYGDNVVLSGPTTLFTGAGVNFGAKLDGSSAVVVNAIDTRFGGAVGSSTALVSLTTDAPGTTQIDGGGITTTGAQLYHDDVTLGADATLKAGSLDFKSVAAQLHNLALDSAGAISLGDVLNATKLNLKAVGDILQKTDSKIVVGELSGDTHGRTILFNDDNQIVTIGKFTAGGDLLIFDSGTSGGGAVYGMNVTGDVAGRGSVWLVEGSGGLKVDPTGSVKVDGVGNALLLVGGLDLALGVPGSGELVLKGKIDLTGGARGFLVMNSIGVSGFGGSDLTGAKDLIKSLNFSFDPSLPTVFGAALRDQADVGPLDYTALANVIASKLPNPMLGPLTAAVFQSPKPDTDSASQISDIVALVRGFFNDLDTGDEKVTNDASAIVEIGKLARFESGVYPPAYGPFALTSYEYEWWLQEKDGKVKDKDLFYNKRYPLYLKQKGSGPNGRPNYESILEDR